jgi:hypothetical protein
MNDYVYPDTLVSTDWVAEHLSDHLVRILEVDVDTSAYETRHLPGAIGWNWETQLQDQLTRDVINKENFELLCAQAGISNDIIVVLYGDNDNWFAAKGRGKAVLDNIEHKIEDDYAVVIPAGTRHNIINTSKDKEMKLYTIYSPPEHRDGVIHKTKADALTDDEHFNGMTTE